MLKRNIVALDGSSGTGKTTIAVGVAKKLNEHNIKAFAFSSGVIFRLLAKYPEIDWTKMSIDNFIKNADDSFWYTYNEMYYNLDPDTLQDEEIGFKASSLSQDVALRKIVTQVLRDFGKKWNDYVIVMDGRDLTSGIFKKDALAKFYLDADLKQVAEWRAKQLNRNDVDEIAKALEKRNQQDKTRKIAPLVKTADTQLLNTTSAKLNDLIDTVYKEIVKNLKAKEETSTHL